MSKNPAILGLLTIAILGATSLPADAQSQQQNLASVLGVRPKWDDVPYSTPTGAELAKCNLKTETGGYLLTDGNNQILRKFIDTTGKGKNVDIYSFYKDGAEVYRETRVGNKWHLRWLGAGGMKWAIGDAPPGGKLVIETWQQISAEEAAQEAFQALATGDFERMKALFITPQEMQALGMSAAEAQKLMALQQNAKAEFQKVRGQLPNLPKATFQRLENAKPGAFLPDMTGGKADIVRIPSGLILFENDAANPKKHDWINANDLIQVGNAWRLTAIPSPEVAGGVDPVLIALLEQLKKIDAVMPAPGTGKLGAWTLQRIQVVQKIAEKSTGGERENWYKQVSDNLATAVVDGDKSLVPVLKKWKDDFAKSMPGSNLAAYAAYRDIWSNHQLIMGPLPANKIPKAQEEFHEELAKFLQAYPKCDDAPDALIQIATGSEFAGKDDEAKKWYGQIVTNFPQSNNAQKAAGALRRIDSVGQKFVLTGQTLADKKYTLPTGKITVVYYWASYSTQSTGDFATLKKLQQTFPKDLEIVGVNLDEKAAQASNFLQGAPPLFVEHLHDAGAGINGPLATYYGIFGLPHLFLLDRDGKVVSNKVQTNALEEEIGKLTKK